MDMTSDAKNPAAVKLGKARAKAFTSASQSEAVKARWKDHVKCDCGKCPACRMRRSRAQKRTAKQS